MAQKKHKIDLVTFSITANERHMGWAPWRLISRFPKEIEELMLPPPTKVPPEYYEAKISPPFDKIKLRVSTLEKVYKLYKENWPDGSRGVSESWAFKFIRYFLCDLRDCFWMQFDFEQAKKRYSQLLDKMEEFRKEKRKFPLDDVILFVGLILWEKHVHQQIVQKKRRDITKANKLIRNDSERLRKHYFIKILNELGFASLQQKYRWRFKDLTEEITGDIQAKLKPYEDLKRESSPVFIYLNIKLVELIKMHFATLDETYTTIADFYQIFGVPKEEDVDSTLVLNYYREWVNRKKELLDYINQLYCKELL